MEGRPPEHPDGLTSRPEEEAEDAEAYLQSVALMYTETLMQAVGERRFLPAAVAGGEHHQRLAHPAHANAGRGAARGDRGGDRGLLGLRGASDSEDAADFVVNLNAFPRPARWSWRETTDDHVLTRPTPRRVPLYGWLTAECISLLGTRVSMIAIPWLVLTTTGSATQTGLVAFAEITPMVLFKAFGGPLVDRVGPRRMAITADLLSFVAVGMIPLLHHSGALTFPLLLGLVAIAGALRGPGDAATNALIPALVERADVPYERATGLSSAIERGATMIGAAIAGGLVVTVGAANAVAIDALSFAVCALVLLVTTRSLEGGGRDLAAEHEDDATTTSYVAELRAGWDFLRRDAVLMSLCLMVALTNLLDLAWSAVLLPVWAHDSGAGVGAVGLVFSVWGGASMLGSVVAAAYGTRLPRLADLPGRVPDHRAAAVRAVRDRRAALDDPRDVPGRRRCPRASSTR